MFRIRQCLFRLMFTTKSEFQALKMIQTKIALPQVPNRSLRLQIWKVWNLSFHRKKKIILLAFLVHFLWFYEIQHVRPASRDFENTVKLIFSISFWHLLSKMCKNWTKMARRIIFFLWKLRFHTFQIRNRGDHWGTWGSANLVWSFCKFWKFHFDDKDSN